jgi:peptide/nickel transport system substrate-binding protein
VEDARRTYHRLKMNARRRIRRQKRQVENITVQADNSLERHFFKRISRLYEVRRFVVSWSLLLLFIGVGAIWQVKGLDKFYLELAPVSGGTYREGIIGSFTTANPLFSVGSADVAVSELVFSGLFRLSPGSVLEPDLAIDYKIDATGLKYTVRLRDDVYWHDGKKFTASDVVFTYNTIKNPEVKSPLFAGWSTVSVSAIDDFNVEFTLPNILSSFQFSLTNGIVPEHILGTIAAADLRSTTFNTVNPIGTGPFVYKSVEVIGTDIDKRAEKVMLESNSNYFRSVPKIDGITIRTYRDEEVMQEAFIDKEIASMVGLQTVSDTVLADESVKTFSTPLSSQVMVFMNNSSPLLNDVKVRQALLRATDTKKIRDSIGYQLVESDSPFLKSHFTYNAEKTQKGYDVAEADRLLNEAGWIKAADGMRYKNNQMLKLNLVSQSLSEYSTVARGIQQQWGELGVSVVPLLKPEEDIQSGSIGSHDYDVLLYGISVGPDPDVFAYWHSSQADPRVKSRLNLSEFKNQQADTALESGRTRLDESLRKIKYEPFIDAWLNDTPAIALYQPRFLFVVRGTLEGYSTGEFNSPSDRFYSISNWQVRRDRIIKQ